MANASDFLETPTTADYSAATSNYVDQTTVAQNTGSDQYNAGSAIEHGLKYGLQGLVAGFVDTTGTSLGLLDDDDVANTLKSTFGPNGFGDWYARNRTAVRTASDIATIMLPGKLASMGLKSVREAKEAGALGEYLKNSKVAGALLGESTRMANVQRDLYKTERLNKTAQAGALSGRSLLTPAVRAARGQYYKTKLANSLRDSVAFEVSYAAMDNNSVLMPGDQTTSDYVKWGVAGAGLGAGLEMVGAKFAAGYIMRRAASVSAKTDDIATNLSKTFYRPGQRGVGLAIDADSRNSLRAEAQSADNARNAEYRSNLIGDTSLLDGKINKTLDDMSKDKYSMPTPDKTTTARLSKALPDMSLSTEQKRLLSDSLDESPSLLVDSEKLSGVPRDRDAFKATLADGQLAIDSKRSVLKELYADGNGKMSHTDYTREMRQLSNMEERLNHHRFVFENDGHITDFNDRATRWFDTHSSSEFKHIDKPDESLPRNADGAVQHNRVWSVKSDSGHIITIDHNLKIGLPKNPTQEDYKALHALGSHVARKWKPLQNDPGLLIDENRTLPELDLIEAMSDVNPNYNDKLMRLGGSFGDAGDAAYAMVDKRYKQYLQEYGKMAGKQGRAALSPAEINQRLNMPVMQMGEPAPLMHFFNDLRMQGARGLSDVFDRKADGVLENIQSAIKESADVPDSKAGVEITGSEFRQREIKPVMSSGPKQPAFTMSIADIEARQQELRQANVDQLVQTNPTTAPVIAATVQNLVGTAALDEARKVETLWDGAQNGRGILNTADRQNEYVGPLKAAALISQTNDQLIKQAVSREVAPLAPFTAQIRDTKNTSDMLDVNRVHHAYRHGFVVDHIAKIAGEDGKLKYGQYVLAQDPRNERVLHSYFGNKAMFPEDADGNWLMPDMSLASRNDGNIVALRSSALATQTMEALNGVVQKVGRESNVIRKRLGLAPIALRKFHLPAPEIDEDTAWFVQGPNGRAANVYSTGTSKANKAQALEAANALSKKGAKYVAVPAQTVRDQAAADGVFLHVIDYSDMLKKNRSMKGGLIGAKIDNTPTTYLNMVRSLTNQYLQIGKRARGMLFEPQMNYARVASKGMEGSKNVFGGEYNIFDQYVQTIMGRSTRNPDGRLARAYNGVTDVLDAGLSRAYDVVHPAAKQLTMSLRNKSGASVDQQIYDQYAKDAEKWDPFGNAQAYLESTYTPAKTWTTRATLGELSKISNALITRMLNPGTALLNYAGVATVMPAVVSAMRRQAGESEADWRIRNAAFGTEIKPGMISFSPTKAITQAMGDVWKGTHSKAMAKASDMGMLDPEYTSIDRILTQENLGQKKGLDRFIDALSSFGGVLSADRSELESRKIVWGMGYSMAKKMFGMQDDRNAFIFAQHMVNQVIGNYSPLNKPGVFQGALGMPLGAFQTYMFNYYRRLFSYVERGDKRALAVQAAAQASVFGVSGLPGWNSWNQFIGADDSGIDTFESRITRNLPSLASELLLHGSVSNIPRIFGAQDGIALYSRGGVDMTKYLSSPGEAATMIPNPLSYLSNIDQLSSVQFLTNTAKLIGGTLQNAMSGFSLHQEEEIMSHFSTNRFVKNIMEMAAGQSTDKQGQIIKSNTRNFLQVAATLAGSVPTSEREMQDAYYKQRLVESHQSALRKELNQRIRARIRAGNLSVDDMQDAVFAYIKSGGNPQYFGTWLRSNVITATDARTNVMMKKLMNSGKGLEFQTMLSALQMSPGASYEDSDQLQ